MSENLQHIIETFKVLEDVARAIARNQVRGLIVYGPAGVGKGANIRRALSAGSVESTFETGETEFKHE